MAEANDPAGFEHTSPTGATSNKSGRPYHEGDDEGHATTRRPASASREIPAAHNSDDEDPVQDSAASPKREIPMPQAGSGDTSDPLRPENAFTAAHDHDHDHSDVHKDDEAHDDEVTHKDDDADDDEVAHEDDDTDNDKVANKDDNTDDDEVAHEEDDTDDDAHGDKDAHEDDDVDKGTTYLDVMVLLLTFEFQDLDLATETKNVRAAFESLEYSVEEYDIPMMRSQRCLQKKISLFLGQWKRGTLMIVYYHGHGGLCIGRGRGSQSGFAISSHNYPASEHPEDIIRALWDGLQIDDKAAREHVSEQFAGYQQIASVMWEDVQDDLIEAGCDTLTILDCCEAGLAAVSDLQDISLRQFQWQRELVRDDRQFHATRNEMIAACTWGNSALDGMSPALIEVLKRNLSHHLNAMSGLTLIRDMNKVLAMEYIISQKKRYRDDYVMPQAAHYLLRRTMKRKILLPNLSRGGQPSSQASSRVEMDIHFRDS